MGLVAGLLIVFTARGDDDALLRPRVDDGGAANRCGRAGAVHSLAAVVGSLRRPSDGAAWQN